ncbi:MAG: ABC transporter permease [Candidatus Melainabacteria bacterium]|nr:ABC transporter permease [Candidatus Melainabacteria bacterium]
MAWRRREILGPLAALLAVYLVFCWLSPSSFAGAANLELILRQTTIVGLVSLGMTIVIIAGGIDLSIGSAVALSTVVIASLLNAGISPIFAALGGIAVGALAGLANGLMVARLKVVPFIATLVSLLVLRGIAKGIAHEQKVDAPLTWLNELLARLDSVAAWQLVPAGVWLFLLMAALVALMLRYSRLGLHVFAVGSNVKTALLCGINVERVELWVYSLCGAFAGLAGLMQFSRLTVGDPTVASGLELDAIAAVVIGGASLKGGRGSVLGTIIGALLMAVLRAGCTQIGLANWIQEIVTGLIILAAVGFDRLRYRQS